MVTDMLHIVRIKKKTSATSTGHLFKILSTQECKDLHSPQNTTNIKYYTSRL